MFEGAALGREVWGLWTKVAPFAAPDTDGIAAGLLCLDYHRALHIRPIHLRTVVGVQPQRGTSYAPSDWQ
jgi:hypothetical protein